jgi:hypothetical protein
MRGTCRLICGMRPVRSTLREQAEEENRRLRDDNLRGAMMNTSTSNPLMRELELFQPYATA